MSTTNKRAPQVSRCLYMLTKNRLQLGKHKEIFSWIFLTLFYLLDFRNHHEKSIKCKLIRVMVEFKCLEGCWMSVAWFYTMQNKSWYRLKRKIIQFSQNMPSICIPEKIPNILKTSWKYFCLYVKWCQVPGSENHQQSLHLLNMQGAL